MTLKEIIRESGLKKADLNAAVFGYSAKKDQTYLIVRDDDEITFFAAVNGRLSAAEFRKCTFEASDEYESCFYGQQSGAAFADLADLGEADDEDAEDEAPAAKPKKGKK